MRRRLGQELRRRRRALDLTLETVADRLGVSITTVHGYESGRIDVPLSRLVRLARVLRVSVAELTEQQAA